MSQRAPAPPCLRAVGEKVVGLVARSFADEESRVLPLTVADQQAAQQLRPRDAVPTGTARTAYADTSAPSVVPPYEHRVRPVPPPQPRNHVPKADDRVHAHRLRHRSDTPMRERVSVDVEESSKETAIELGDASIRPLASCRFRDVAARRSSDSPQGRRSDAPIRPSASSCRLLSPRPARGDAGFDANARSAELGLASKRFTIPFGRRVLPKHRGAGRYPTRQATGGLIATASRCPPPAPKSTGRC